MPGAAHFRSGVYRDHVHRVALVQPRRRSYSVTSDKSRGVRIISSLNELGRTRSSEATKETRAVLLSRS